MKRSEANRIFKKRVEFSSVFDCFSIKDDSEAYFNRSGCNCCDGGAVDVFDVTCLRRDDIEKKVFTNVYDAEICGPCLSSFINGDDSDLDFYVTNEDEKKAV
jgi:hypothetical protein